MASVTYKKIVIDCADAYRATTGTTEKIQVGNLAGKISALENVTPEVTAQTALITEITESLVGKVTGANATPEDILEGKCAYVGQKLVEGNLKVIRNCASEIIIPSVDMELGHREAAKTFPHPLKGQIPTGCSIVAMDAFETSQTTNLVAVRVSGGINEGVINSTTLLDGILSGSTNRLSLLYDSSVRSDGDTITFEAIRSSGNLGVLYAGKRYLLTAWKL